MGFAHALSTKKHKAASFRHVTVAQSSQNQIYVLGKNYTRWSLFSMERRNDKASLVKIDLPVDINCWMVVADTQLMICDMAKKSWYYWNPQTKVSTPIEGEIKKGTKARSAQLDGVLYVWTDRSWSGSAGGFDFVSSSIYIAQFSIKTGKILVPFTEVSTASLHQIQLIDKNKTRQ